MKCGLKSLLCLTIVYACIIFAWFNSGSRQNKSNILSAFDTENRQSHNASDSVLQHRSDLFDLGIDYVVSAFDESPDIFLNRLKSCVRPNLDRVFIYVKAGESLSRRHRSKVNRISHPEERLSAWISIKTKFPKIVLSVPNIWCCDEAAAYLYHIVSYFNDMQSHLAFLHAHTSSWHSTDVCYSVRNGFEMIRNSHYGFQNINSIDKRRCISSQNIEDDSIATSLRDFIFFSWANWTNGASIPTRIVWVCCIQSMVSKQSIHHRPLNTWRSLLEAAQRTVNDPQDSMKIPWEYLWPTLMDEKWATDSGSC